jgi:hypothetical protein
MQSGSRSAKKAAAKMNEKKKWVAGDVATCVAVNFNYCSLAPVGNITKFF